MKKGFTLIELLITIALIGLLAIVVCQCFRGCRQMAVKNFGGSMTVNLDPNVKLVNVTWKNNEMWILTTERTNESPKSYNFSEKSTMGILQGNVRIVEK